MSRRPSISVIMTCYNCEPYIREAICSVFAQDYDGETELIVVDDASTDGSLRVIESTLAAYGQGKRVKLIRHEKNLGVVGATDSGMRAAEYEWFVFADGDDIQKPDRCRLMVERLAAYPAAKAVITSHQQVDAERRHLWYGSYLAGYPYSDELPACVCLDSAAKRAAAKTDAAAEQFVVYGCCFAMHRSLYEQWGDMLPGGAGLPRFYQDPVLENRALLSAPFLGTKDVSVEYRCHGGNLFNYSRPCESVADYMKAESEPDERLTARRASYAMISRDLHRALANSNLTDWTPEQIRRVLNYVEQHIQACDMRRHWWQWSWLRRFAYLLTASKNLPPEFKKWPRNRMMPLRLFAALKWWRSRKGRA